MDPPMVLTLFSLAFGAFLPAVLWRKSSSPMSMAVWKPCGSPMVPHILRCPVLSQKMPEPVERRLILDQLKQF